MKHHLEAIRGGIDTTNNMRYQEYLEQLDYLATVNRASRGGTITSTENYEVWQSIPARVKILYGILTKGNIPNGEQSRYSCVKYKFLLEAPFDVSSMCCNVLKKDPVHRYTRISGRKPMTAQMASESKLRTQQWLRNGCNGFDMKAPISNPMSFWTEQDVLLYIKLNNLPICSVYGDVVIDYEAENNVEGQMDLSELSADFGLFDTGNRPLKTTGCSRTGCTYCGYGCHLEKKGEGRFERMKYTHPKIYDYIMRPKEQGGLNYKEIIDWLNENGKLNIRY